MDELDGVVVRGCHVQVPDKFRDCVAAKVGRLRRFDRHVLSVEVVLSEERNPRLSDLRERVEITIHRPGHVLRAHFAAADCCSAFDQALDRAVAQLRRVSERRQRKGARPTGSGAVPVTADALGR